MKRGTNKRNKGELSFSLMHKIKCSTYVKLFWLDREMFIHLFLAVSLLLRGQCLYLFMNSVSLSLAKVKAFW